MHLPAQYECMPRGAERLSGESHTVHMDEGRIMGRAEGNKSLKLQYDRWRERERQKKSERETEREEGQKTAEWFKKKKRERAAEQERG